jgi:hypothetical protein
VSSACPSVQEASPLDLIPGEELIVNKVKPPDGLIFIGKFFPLTPGRKLLVE